MTPKSISGKENGWICPAMFADAKCKGKFDYIDKDKMHLFICTDQVDARPILPHQISVCVKRSEQA